MWSSNAGSIKVFNSPRHADAYVKYIDENGLLQNWPKDFSDIYKTSCLVETEKHKLKGEKHRGTMLSPFLWKGKNNKLQSVTDKYPFKVLRWQLETLSQSNLHRNDMLHDKCVDSMSNRSNEGEHVIFGSVTKTKAKWQSVTWSLDSIRIWIQQLECKASHTPPSTALAPDFQTNYF